MTSLTMQIINTVYLMQEMETKQIKKKSEPVSEILQKEIIDTKSSFADWLNNQIVRGDLKFDIKLCLVKNGYPPQYSPEVFNKVMEQAENFKKYN